MQAKNFKRNTTNKPNNTAHMDDSHGGFNHQFSMNQQNENKYAEKPRPNLYNVIMRHRENSVGFRHCLLIVKMNDFEAKGDLEEIIKSQYTRISDDDGNEFLQKVTGLCCIMGNYYVQVLETQDDLFLKLVLNKIASQIGQNPYLDQAWVLHHTEEVPDSHFREYTVRSMNPQNASKEIRNYSQYERIAHIYESMVNIGDSVATAIDQGKGITSITSIVKQNATETIPVGEELTSALSPADAFTLRDWLDFVGPPDICLEKEMCWPVEPELVY